MACFSTTIFKLIIGVAVIFSSNICRKFSTLSGHLNLQPLVRVTELRGNVKNEITLICAKFGANVMVSTSKVTAVKHSGPRFFWPTVYIIEYKPKV